MSNKCAANNVLLRNETYYFLKRVPTDLTDYYSVKRLCFSLKTKSYSSALRITKSVLQRLEDLYLRYKGNGKGKDKTFVRTANRNIEYIIKVLGN